MTRVLAPGNGVAFADWPRNTAANLSSLKRSLPWLEQGMERDAWAALFDDEQQLHTFRTVYGNRPGPRPRTPHLTLFDFEPTGGTS